MIKRSFSEAKEYVAPNHRACTTLRLFGAEMGGSKALIAGVSHFLPGGGNGKETVLKKNDSCYIGPNESREIVNRGNDVCTIFVAVAAPPA